MNLPRFERGIALAAMGELTYALVVTKERGHAV
jgi:hypothetical protein